jgi:PD-(D/E)XK endonuclease
MIRDNEKIYKGKAAQLHVMSQLLLRGWNVAIPEIDTGDDVLVVKDETGELRKVQVKSTYTVLQQDRNHFKVKFNIPGKQLTREQPVELTYFFVVLKNGVWHSQIIIIQRDQLEYKLSLMKENTNKENINFYVTFSKKKAISQSEDFSGFINDYSLFPVQF